MGPTNRYHRHRILFDDPETDQEFLAIRERFVEELEARREDEERAKQRMLLESVRKRQFAERMARHERGVITAARAWRDALATAHADDIDTWSENHLEAILVALDELTELEQRGDGPPDCGHVVCLSELTCMMETLCTPSG